MDSQPERPSDVESFMTKEVSTSHAFVQKLQDKPFGTLAIIGLIASCTYAYRKFKKQGTTYSPSIFLMQLRVGAQSAAIGLLGVGVIYELVVKGRTGKRTDHN